MSPSDKYNNTSLSLCRMPSIYSMPRTTMWRSLYVQWHRAGRQPSSDFSGDRFPAFASSRVRRAQDRFHRAFEKRFAGAAGDLLTRESNWREGWAVRDRDL